jgi:hypothetical protein
MEKPQSDNMEEFKSDEFFGCMASRHNESYLLKDKSIERLIDLRQIPFADLICELLDMSFFARQGCRCTFPTTEEVIALARRC